MKVLTEKGIEEAHEEVKRRLAKELPLSDQFSVISAFVYDDTIPAVFLLPLKVLGNQAFYTEGIRAVRQINVDEKLAIICRAKVKMEEIEEAL